MATNFTYSDVDRFLTVSQSGNINVHYDEQAVIQSVKNILSTVSGERVRSPIGSSLIRMLFQPVNAETADNIRNLLLRDLERWEPRVNVLSIDVRPNPSAKKFDVYMDIQIRKISKKIRYTTALRSMAF